MNPDPVLRSDLLAAGVPAAVVVVGSLVGLVLWGGSHRLSAWWLRKHPSRSASAGFFALRLAMGTVALWSVWQAAARWVVLETSWSLWTNAVIGALAVESVTALFQWEKNSIDRTTGRTLLALRLLAVALVLIILVQPVLAWNQQRKIERRGGRCGRRWIRRAYSDLDVRCATWSGAAGAIVDAFAGPRGCA